MTKAVCDRLDDYIDGDLALRERQAFERHVLTCEACREALVRQEALNRRLAELRAHPAPIPAGLVERIRASVPAATPKPAFRRFGLPAAAAAAVLLSAAGMWWFVREPGRRPATPGGPPVTVAKGSVGRSVQASEAFTARRVLARLVSGDVADGPVPAPAWLEASGGGRRLMTRAVRHGATRRVVDGGAEREEGTEEDEGIRIGPRPYSGSSLGSRVILAERRLAAEGSGSGGLLGEAGS